MVGRFIDLGRVQHFESFIAAERRRSQGQGFLEQAVQGTGPDRAGSVLLDLLNTPKQPIEIFAGLGGNQVNRGVTEEEKIPSDLLQ